MPKWLGATVLDVSHLLYISNALRCSSYHLKKELSLSQALHSPLGEIQFVNISIEKLRLEPKVIIYKLYQHLFTRKQLYNSMLFKNSNEKNEAEG